MTSTRVCLCVSVSPPNEGEVVQDTDTVIDRSRHTGGQGMWTRGVEVWESAVVGVLLCVPCWVCLSVKTMTSTHVSVSLSVYVTPAD